MRPNILFRGIWLLLLSTGLTLSAQQKLPEAYGGAGGLWLPVNVPSQHHATMSEIGLSLSPENLYNPKDSDISDAVVVLNGGMCTAEAVSERGMLFTNHHCAFDAVAVVSTEENDHLTNGYWAHNAEEEIRLEGMTAGFLIRQENVTAKVLGERGDASQPEIQSRIEELETAATEGTSYEATVEAVLNGNAYYLFVYETFRDVRLVGIPPIAIGKYGYDQDNFEWPRHTGDFAVLRVYADADNHPADYSPDNVPYRPTYHLPISLAGVEEGDFQMSYGYPGSTDRYLSAAAIEQQLETFNPARIALIGQSGRLMNAAMKASNAQRIVLSEHFAGLMNTLKFYEGETEMAGRYDIVSKKKAAEREFLAWVAEDEERQEAYGDLLSGISQALTERENSTLFREMLIFCALHPDIAPQALVYAYNSLQQLQVAYQRGNEAAAGQILEALKADKADYLDGLIIDLDKDIFVAHFVYAYETLPAELHPEIFSEIASGKVQPPAPPVVEEPEEETKGKKKKRKKKKRKKKKKKGKKGPVEESPLVIEDLGSLSLEERARRWTDSAYAQSIMTDEARLTAFLHAPDPNQLQADPLNRFVSDFLFAYLSKHNPIFQRTGAQLAELRKAYVKGLMERYPDAQFYANANSTMRLAYGKVQGYEPRDGVIYEPFTTLAGAIEKELANPGDADFFIPAKLKELYEAKDYGRYGKDGQLVTCYLNTLDNTGGGSGSPSLNARGELTGLLFDGNWEGMTGDIYVMPQFARSIVVDIRYVLFIIDKFAGADYIMKELTIVE